MSELEYIHIFYVESATKPTSEYDEQATIIYQNTQHTYRCQFV